MMMRVFTRSLVCIAALVVLAATVSCGSDPIATGKVRHVKSSFDSATYVISPGFSANPTILELKISWEHGVRARRISAIDLSVVEENSRLLTSSELWELARLFKPFPDFEDSYILTPAPTDGDGLSIELSVNDTSKQVVVYPRHFSGIPDELRELRDVLDALFAELLGTTR